MATIGRLGLGWPALRRHLFPRRRAAVVPGTERTFPPGLLRSADLVTCDIRGHHLEQGVPDEPGGAASAGFGGENVVSVALSVSLARDGSVHSSCHVGRP
jgi:hypothetical protein